MDASTPPSTPTSWRTEVVMAVATGVVTTYLPIQRWPRPAQWAVHGGMGVMSAGAIGWLMSRPEPGDDSGKTASPPPPAALTAAVAVLGGAAVVGLSRGGQAADGWLEHKLTTRGVRRPRAWIGLAAAGISLGSAAAERRQG